MGENDSKERKSAAQVAEERGPRVLEAQKLLGRRIRSLREGHGLSQGKLAERAGLSEKYLGEVERGGGNITIELLTKLADALGVTVAAIMENDHEQTRDELVDAIIRMAPKLSEKDAQIVYRMLTLMTHS